MFQLVSRTLLGIRASVFEGHEAPCKVLDAVFLFVPCGIISDSDVALNSKCIISSSSRHARMRAGSARPVRHLTPPPDEYALAGFDRKRMSSCILSRSTSFCLKVVVTF